MRLDINLASKPYQDVRRFLLQWGTLALVLTACSLALVWYTIATTRASRDVNEQIARTQAEIRKLEEQRAAATAILNRPENRFVVEQSRFLNDAIARKAFSWTQVFMQLEQIMPPQIHVVSMAPKLTNDNRLQLQMSVAGNSRERAVELVRRLESSSVFQDARLISETEALPGQTGSSFQAGSGDTIVFSIVADYLPQGAFPASYLSTENVNDPETTVRMATGSVLNRPSAAVRNGVR